MRRLPVYFLIDNSVSAIGEPADIGQQLVQSAVAQWCFDPYALETLYISIITFNNSPRLFLPLTELSDLKDFSSPLIQEFSLDTVFGSALDLLVQRISIEVKISEGTYESYRVSDYKPLVLLIISSEPTDNWEANLEKIKKIKFMSIVALVTNPNFDTSFLSEITKDIVKLNAESFNQIINSCFRRLTAFVLDDELYENDPKYFWIHKFWRL